MPPANSTLTTDSAPAHSTTEESANAIDGHSANPAEDPVEDTADATDAMDADLLEVFSNNNPTTANLEQYGHPAEAQSFAAASIDPALTPLIYPTVPETDVFVEHFPLGNPGAIFLVHNKGHPSTNQAKLPLEHQNGHCSTPSVTGRLHTGQKCAGHCHQQWKSLLQYQRCVLTN